MMSGGGKQPSAQQLGVQRRRLFATAIVKTDLVNAVRVDDHKVVACSRTRTRAFVAGLVAHLDAELEFLEGPAREMCSCPILEGSSERRASCQQAAPTSRRCR